MVCYVDKAVYISIKKALNGPKTVRNEVRIGKISGLGAFRPEAMYSKFHEGQR